MKLYPSSLIKILFSGITLLTVTSCSTANFPSVARPHTENPQIALQAHNQFRNLHHAPNLVWDDKLANYAAHHASKCIFKHSGSPYGENLAAGYPSFTAAVTGWYREGKQYSYDHPGFSKTTGHFTQVIWKSTQRVGCGYADCNGKFFTPGRYWVCEYSPPGNVTNNGYFAANVLPASR